MPKRIKAGKLTFPSGEKRLNIKSASPTAGSEVFFGSYSTEIL